MIAALKCNGIAYMIAVPYYTVFKNADFTISAHKENINIFKVRGTNILVGSADIGLQADLLKENSKLFKAPTLLSLKNAAMVLKDIFNSYDILVDGELKHEICVAAPDAIYRIDREFNVIECGDVAFVANFQSDFHYLYPLVDMYEGSIKERVIKALKCNLELQSAYNNKLYIINSSDNKIEIL